MISDAEAMGTRVQVVDLSISIQGESLTSSSEGREGRETREEAGVGLVSSNCGRSCNIRVLAWEFVLSLLLACLLHEPTSLGLSFSLHMRHSSVVTCHKALTRASGKSLEM